MCFLLFFSIEIGLIGSGGIGGFTEIQVASPVFKNLRADHDIGNKNRAPVYSFSGMHIRKDWEEVVGIEVLGVESDDKIGNNAAHYKRPDRRVDSNDMNSRSYASNEGNLVFERGASPYYEHRSFCEGALQGCDRSPSCKEGNIIDEIFKPQTFESKPCEHIGEPGRHECGKC